MPTDASSLKRLNNSDVFFFLDEIKDVPIPKTHAHKMRALKIETHTFGFFWEYLEEERRAVAVIWYDHSAHFEIYLKKKRYERVTDVIQACHTRGLLLEILSDL